MDVYPAARRVLLTAYADTDAAITAINVVDLDYYLLKPWDPPEEKFYPVIDSQLDDWRHTDHRAVAGDQGGRAPLVGPVSEVQDFLARNQVPYRWYLSDEPEGERLLAAAGVDGATLPRGDHRGRARYWSSRPTAELADRVGLSTDAGRGLLRPGGGRRRSGGAGCGRIRGVRGPADGAGGTHGHRWPGRPELADRELPGLSRRGVRRPAHRTRAPPGTQVRRRDADDRRRRGRRGERIRQDCAVRRRARDRCARGDPGDRRLLPATCCAGTGRAGRARASFTARRCRRRRAAPDRTSTSSVGRTRRVRPRCTSPVMRVR